MVSIQSILKGSQESGSRSTALNPLIWIIGTLLTSIVASGILGAPAWIIVSLVVILFPVVGVALAAYWHFMKNDPDALRSEPFGLTKYAIEKGVYGDSVMGMIGRLDIPRKTGPSEGSEK